LSVIVSFEEYSFKYSGTTFYALRNINLDIYRGDFILLTGPSGCGKSTLLRSINGLIPHFYEGEYTGRVIVMGHEVSKSSTYELSRYVGMVFQDPENQLFSSTVEREIAFGLENLGLSKEEMRRRVDNVLQILKIENLRHKSPYELSGGQQQKVAIASIMVMEPEILILDEPTANLDPLSALELFELLARLNREMNITIVIVEHRLELITSFINRVLLMDRGRIVADGAPEEVFLERTSKLLGIGVPKVINVYLQLRNRGIEMDRPPRKPEELAVQVRRLLQRRSSK